MRVPALLFTAILAAASAQAQTPKPSSPPDSPANPASSDERELNLPVSLDKIKEALEQTPAISFRTLDERPTFRVQIRERQRIEDRQPALFARPRDDPHRLRRAVRDIVTRAVARSTCVSNDSTRAWMKPWSL